MRNQPGSFVVLGKKIQLMVEALRVPGPAVDHAAGLPPKH